MQEGKRESFDQVALRVSTDDGQTWGEPETVVVSGLDLERYQRPMDPTLLQLSDGRFRLYFASSEKSQPSEFRGQPRGGQHSGNLGRRSAGPGIYSAISSDLKKFTLEEGKRSDRDEPGVVDPTAVLHGSSYYMVAHPESHGMRSGPRSPFELRQGYFATSADGYRFERQMNLAAPSDGDFIGNLFSHLGRLFFFGGSFKGIWSISSQDGKEWGRVSVSQLKGGDPSVFTDSSGKLQVLFVGEVRSDAIGQPEWMKRLNRGHITGPRFDLEKGQSPMRDPRNSEQRR